MKTKLFVLLYLLPAFCFAQSDTASLRKAWRLYESEKLDAAYSAINTLLQKDSSVAEYYRLRGEILFDLDKRREAIADFSKMIQLAPADPIGYCRRAAVLYSTQNPNFAIDDQNAALERVGNNDSLKYAIILNRGSAEIMRRNFANAYKDFMLVLQHDSTDFGALNNIGAVMDELGRSEESVPYLEKVIRLYPKFVGGYLNLAFWNQNKGNYKKALELNNQALEVSPDEPLGYNNRGFVKYKLGDLPGALQDINHSLKLYSTNSYAYRNRALVYIAMKAMDKACADLQQAVENGFTEMYGAEAEQLQAKHCKR